MERTTKFVEDECAQCGRPLLKDIIEVRGYPKKFCSRRCAGIYCFGPEKEGQKK